MGWTSAIWAVLAGAALILLWRLVRGYGEARYGKGYRNAEADRAEGYRRLSDKVMRSRADDDNHFGVRNKPTFWDNPLDPDTGGLVEPPKDGEPGGGNGDIPMPDGRGQGPPV